MDVERPQLGQVDDLLREDVSVRDNDRDIKL